MVEGSSQIKTCHFKTSQLVNDLAPSGIRKFFDLLASMDGVISLGIGEPDYATPWHISQAAIASLEKGYTMYTSNAGMPRLRRELSEYIAINRGVEYSPDTELLITVGVSEGLDLIFRALLNAGDEVLIADPCYVSYPASVLLSGGIPVMIPTDEAHNFELEPEEVEKRITARTRALLIGYPSNPTGAMMPREKFIKLADIARRHNLLVVSDEIYSKLVYGLEHTCFASLPGMKEYTLFLGGFSKSYAMTGWRVGFAAGPADLIAAMNKIHQYTIMCAPTMAQVAAIEALQSGDESAQKMVEDYDRRRKFFVKGLRDIGLSCFEPKGAFYAFPSVKNTSFNSEEFAEQLLIEEKVAVIPGTAFGKCGEGYVRCCYATSLDDISEALIRMERFLKRHNAL